jgi:hypothetical protein
MKRLLLFYSNSLFFVVIFVFATLLQGALFQLPVIHLFQPEMLIFWVFWFATERRFEAGGLLTLLIAHLSEAYTSSPRGVIVVSSILVYFVIRSLVHFFVIYPSKSFIPLTLFSCVCFKLFHLLALGQLDLAIRQWQWSLMTLFFSTLTTTWIGTTFYPLFVKLDELTFHREPSRS